MNAWEEVSTFGYSAGPIPFMAALKSIEEDSNGVASTVLKTIPKVFAEEGAAGLYTGFGVQATKAVLSAAIMMAAKEKIDLAANEIIDSVKAGGVHPKAN